MSAVADHGRWKPKPSVRMAQGILYGATGFEAVRLDFLAIA